MIPFVAGVCVLVGMAKLSVLLSRDIAASRAKVRASIIVILVLIACLTLGYFVGVNMTYSPSSRLQIKGIPIPLVTIILEGETRTDFPIPRPWAYFAIFANLLLPGVVALWLVHLGIRRKSQG